MVEEPHEYQVVLTPQFLDDLEACVDYVSCTLGSPLAAKRMYEMIREKVMDLGKVPQAAVSYRSPTTGKTRYKISYNKYDIHYCIENDIVRVLGVKHQLQNDGWIG